MNRLCRYDGGLEFGSGNMPYVNGYFSASGTGSTGVTKFVPTKGARVWQRCEGMPCIMETLAVNVLPVTENDHVLGKLSAPVKIICFTDLECPFCKDFHETLAEARAEFGDKIAVVYRHFPLPQIHRYAQNEAVATECVAELGGEAKFWEYIDKIFATTNSNDGLPPEMLTRLAKDLCIDEKKFNECLASRKYEEKVLLNKEDALKSGGRWTPWTIVFGAKGKKYLVQRAYPYKSTEPGVPSFKEIIEAALEE